MEWPWRSDLGLMPIQPVSSNIGGAEERAWLKLKKPLGARLSFLAAILRCGDGQMDALIPIVVVALVVAVASLQWTVFPCRENPSPAGTLEITTTPSCRQSLRWFA